MKLLNLPLIASLALATSACSTLEPNIGLKPLEGYDLVDLSKVDAAKYEKDFGDCAVIANQDYTSALRLASNAVGTAADRASFGILGYRSNKDADRSTVLKRCLTGRGYAILR